MSRFANRTAWSPTTTPATLPESFNIRFPLHLEGETAQPEKRTAKDVGNLPSPSHHEAPRPLHLPPDSLEDIIVEKWVGQPSNQAAEDVALKTVLRNERARGTRISPLGSRSKEDKKTRSSTSNAVVLPYKREVPRNALVHLRYRHYYPKSRSGADLRNKNPKSLTYALPKQSSAVPHERFFPHPLDGRTAQLEYDLAFDGDDSLLEGCAPYREEGGTFIYTTGGSILDELDMEWTRERFAHAAIRDDYDSDMTDQ